MEMNKENGFEDMEMDEKSMRRIIESTGLMQKGPKGKKKETLPKPTHEKYLNSLPNPPLPKDSSDVEDAQVESFQASFMAIPLAVLYLLMRWVVHLQFRMDESMSWPKWVGHAIQIYFACTVLVFTTFTRRNRKLYRLILGIIATVAGCGLIWVTEKKRTFGSNLRAPGLAILWVYSIAIGDLSLDVLSLLICLAYRYDVLPLTV